MASNYPLTGFHFKVEWNPDEKENVSFSEVSGLNMSTTAIEYREGSDKDYTTLKMPGLRKYSNITLKRGTMATDNGFFEWFNSIKNNTVTRRDTPFSSLMRNMNRSSRGVSRTLSRSSTTAGR